MMPSFYPAKRARRAWAGHLFPVKISRAIPPASAAIRAHASSDRSAVGVTAGEIAGAGVPIDTVVAVHVRVSNAVALPVAPAPPAARGRIVAIKAATLALLAVRSSFPKC